jgi:transcriptional regulator with GAF, ATPase, and Fis domain
VRELENIVERALIQHREGALSFETLLPMPVVEGPKVVQGKGPGRILSSLSEVNARHIRQAMDMAGGKINGSGGAAQILGLHPNTLRKRMDKLGIPYGRRSWHAAGD